MKQFVAQIESISPYSPSRDYSRDVPKRAGESPDDYEKRTWRHRCHHTADGSVFMPPTSFKESLAAAGKRLSLKKKGQSTWAKHFSSGIIVSDALMLSIQIDDVQGEWLSLNSDGVKGGGKRVWKCMPRIDNWGGTVTYHAVDAEITLDVFSRHLEASGTLVGLGRFRPEKGGWYGRFRVARTEQIEG